MTDPEEEDDGVVSPFDRLVALYYRAPPGDESLELDQETNED